MLWNIFVILLFLWLPALVSGYTMGGVIHILLFIAIIILGVDIFRDKRQWKEADSSGDDGRKWEREAIGGKRKDFANLTIPSTGKVS